jgi:hypothetical protein
LAKTKNPLFSFGAVGSLAHRLTFRRSHQDVIAESVPTHADAKTGPQLAHRVMFQQCKDLWHTLSAGEKLTWEAAAREKHMTGYAYYISLCLKPNPGIYLPLAGGTMKGNVGADPGVTFDGVDLSEIPLGSYLPLAGGTMAGNINMATKRIINLPAPVANEEPLRKVDASSFISSWTLGKYLLGAGAGVAPTEVSGWQKIAEVVAPSNCDYVDFTSLDINTDKLYLLFANVRNSTAGVLVLSLFRNGDYTVTNYYVQYLLVTGAVISGGRGNTAGFVGMTTATSAAILLYITKDIDGYLRARCSINREPPSTINWQDVALASNVVAANITSLRISADVSGGIKTGSTLLLCKPRTS